MNEKTKRVLTGDRPTGKLHLGHFVGSIANRLKLQSENSECYYMIADVQALTDNAADPEKVRANVLEVALDNLACGMDPTKTTMFIQSQIPEIAELTIFFLNLVTLSRLKQNPTVKTEMLQKNFKENVPAGFLMYPVSQAADILTFKASIVPVGGDQLPMLEQTNEIIDKFNALYGPIFERITPMIPEHARIPGIDGTAKMSKSLNNAIYLSDTPEEIERKVKLMYTDPNHIHVHDPGKIEGNVVFTYLDLFDKDSEGLAELKKAYSSGGVGDVILKKRLTEILNTVITPMRERRAVLERNPEEIMEILQKGTVEAKKVAQNTLSEVREHMRIDYF